MKQAELSSEVEVFERTERLLCQWGDETRAHAERLGYPSSSPISRMIEQQRVFEQRKRDVRRKRPASTPTKLRDGTAAKLCACGRVYIEGECVIGTVSVCPRCRHDPRAPEAESHGAETRSLKPATSAEFTTVTLAIESIVVDAPGWMQKVLRRRYLFKQPDSGAAQDLRMRKTRYREELKASVEYVAHRLAVRRVIQ